MDPYLEQRWRSVHHRLITYMACVRRGWKRDVAELCPLRLAEPLPAIRIPLRESDADVTLNLQALIDHCYENGGCDNIDYRQPPVLPRLPSGSREWNTRAAVNGPGPLLIYYTRTGGDPQRSVG
jgi:hypothetical protein